MAKATLNKKFKTYSGVLPPSGHRFYLTNRFGQEIISHMPEHRDPDSVTEAQRQAFQLIKQASALADADLQDPLKHDEWLRKWNEHSALCASRSAKSASSRPADPSSRPADHSSRPADPSFPRSTKPYKTLRGFVIAAYRQQL